MKTSETPSERALYQRKWREANPEKVAAINRRSQRKQSIRKAKVRAGFRESYQGSAEVIRLSSRGRDASTIAILLGMRVSRVTEILNQKTSK
jgi:hypothetical protein